MVGWREAERKTEIFRYFVQFNKSDDDINFNKLRLSVMGPQALMSCFHLLFFFRSPCPFIISTPVLTIFYFITLLET